MRLGARARYALAAAVGTVALGIGAAAAGAAEAQGIIAPQHDPPSAADGWQAGTCTVDDCTPDSPTSAFYTQAAGHPDFAGTQFIVRQDGSGFPVGNIHNVRVDLPVGLSVNPQAAPQCPQATFEANPASCPAGSQVGGSAITLSAKPPLLPALDLAPVPGLTDVDVYNIVPPPGEPARFGFQVAGNNVYLKAGIAWWDDYHEFFTIDGPKASDLPLLGDLPIPLDAAVRILKNRLNFNGRAGNGTFVTLPSTCLDPDQPGNQGVYATYVRADSYEQPDPSFPAGSPLIAAGLPDGIMPTGCAEIPFDPSISVAPGTARTDHAAAATVDVQVPFDPSAELANSNVRTATVTLPEGMGLNPSAANGLAACSDAQFGKGTTRPVSCPSASKIGTVSIDTPVLPPGSITGDVFVGEPRSSNPASGRQFRIFVDGESPRYGVSVRLVGNVAANPRTGRLTATFDDLPQVPFTSFELRFGGGPHAVLASPATCGPHTTSTRLVPYSTPASTRSPSAPFALGSGPYGGGCARTLADRPFAPSFAAGTASKAAGSFTSFTLKATRRDGEQELSAIEATLPPGVSAVLKGVPYCPEAAIAAAATKRGAGERAAPSCPAASQVGVTRVAAGAGPDPLRQAGRVYLAGPYKGAPVSLAIVVPALAGPFDLGTVVVRAAVFVDPTDAHLTVRSDPLPRVVGGVPLHLRSLVVDINRPNFMINPTSCDAKAVRARILGSHGASAAGASGLRVGGCQALDFSPKMRTKIIGGRKATKRSRNPGLRATLDFPTDGRAQANTKRVALRLPKVIFLDQENTTDICTRPQFAANACPTESIYGHATAVSPLLHRPLSGPVYMRSSDNPLPDLVADLHGQVDIELAGRIDTVKRAIRTSFETVPDVPVSHFELEIAGGKGGLLVNSKNLCKGQTKKGKKLKRKAKHQKRKAKKLRKKAKKASGKKAKRLRKKAKRAKHRAKKLKRRAKRHTKRYRSKVELEGQNGALVKQRPKLKNKCHKRRRHHGGGHNGHGGGHGGHGGKGHGHGGNGHGHRHGGKGR